MKYNYLKEIKNDIMEYIKENNINLEEINEEDLLDTLYLEDSITGNASGSYTMSTWQAEENLAHNLELLKEACEMLGTEAELDNPEACDVMIRCYVLPRALDEVIKEMM